MKLKSKKQSRGQALIETLFVLPLLLGILFWLVETTLVSFSTHLTQWVSFDTARQLLVIAWTKKSEAEILASARARLSCIPFQKEQPRIDYRRLNEEVRVEIHQTLRFFIQSHEISQKMALHE